MSCMRYRKTYVLKNVYYTINSVFKKNIILGQSYKKTVLPLLDHIYNKIV